MVLLTYLNEENIMNEIKISPKSKEILSLYFVGMAEYCIEDCFEDHCFTKEQLRTAYNEITQLSYEQLLAFVPECAEEWDPDNPGFVETMEHAVKCYWADEQNPKTASENGMFGHLIDFEAQME